MIEKNIRRMTVLILVASGLFVLITAEIEKNDERASIGRHRAGGSQTATLEENKMEFESIILKKRILGLTLLSLGAATIFIWKDGPSGQVAIKSR